MTPALALTGRAGAARAGDTLTWAAAAALAGLGVLAAIAQLPLHPVLAAAAGLGLLAAAAALLQRPALGACALIVIIYWNASDVITQSFGFSWLLRLAIAAALAAGLFDLLTRADSRRWRWPVLAPVLAYGAAQAAAALGAADAAAARGSLIEYGKAMIVFYLVANLLNTPRALRWGVNALLLGVLLLSLPVVYQGLTGSQNQFLGFGAMVYEEIVPGSFGWRLGGAIGDPNFLAMVLVATLPLALMQALEHRVSRRRRAWALLVAAAALTATFYTYSRAAFVGVALVAVVFALKHRRRQTVLAGAAAAVLAAALLMPQQFFSRLDTLTQLGGVPAARPLPDSSYQLRLNALYAGALMFAAHPLLGVGPGNYPDSYWRFSAIAGLASDPVMRDPHNLYIQIAAETGLAGLITFFLLMAASFRLMARGRRRLRRLGAEHFADLVWALELALATYLVLSLFLHGAYFRHFLLLLALGTLAGSLAESPALAPAPAPGAAAAPPTLP